jgi:hypothetical protein
MAATYTLTNAELTTEYALERADWLRKVVLSFLASSNAPRVATTATHELELPDTAAPSPTADLEDLPF